MVLRYWSVTTNGTYDFNNPANWLYGSLPSALDTAAFETAVTDTITGNATLGEILVSATGSVISLAGMFSISNVQSTELSVLAQSTVTILPGALVNGAQGVLVNGSFATLNVQGGLVASGLTISNEALVYVSQGSGLDITGSISISNGGCLIGRSGPGPNANIPLVISNAIVVTGGITLGSYGVQETDFNGVISGTGSINPVGDGQADIVGINGTNTFSGGAFLNGLGLTVAAGNASAFGTGTLTIDAGELLATTTETIGNQLALSGNFTIAAAHGQTLTLGTAYWSLNAVAGELINFGAPGQDGVVVFKESAGAALGGAAQYTVTVAGGTLRAADSGLGIVLNNDLATVVQAGATLDLAGFNFNTNDLQGGGHIGDSAGAANLGIINGGFSGIIDGSLNVTIAGSVDLTGADTYTGGTTIAGNSELTLGNGGTTGSITGNIVDNGALEFRLSNTLVESGVISGSGLVLQDGAGTTVLTQTNSYTGATFLAGGTLELQQPGSAGSGAIDFLPGANSTLQIDGATMPTNPIISFSAIDTIDLRGVSANGWTYSGNLITLLQGATTVAQLTLPMPFPHPDFSVASDGAGGVMIHLEPQPGQFTGNGVSDVLMQNSDGTPAISLMNGLSVLSTTNLSNPGSSWSLIGTGDFNGDGKSDFLWQNSSGIPAIWELNGTSIIGSAGLSNPGATWKLVGTGDFNGDGRSDLLFQNSDGTPAIWEMNGLNVIGGAGLSNPGATWKLVGTGDFNGDGKSDLVFQNSDGTPAIWLMNGTTVTSGAGLQNPGASWKLVGTGDFNGDGKSDLVFQNTNGTPAIWEMNGTSLLASAALSNPGAGWKLIGTGDFNGDGKSDLLFQYTDGTPAIWEMNGTSLVGSGGLSDPGAAWHLIPLV
jgi:autotransporter-associated beta strand protein